MPPSDRNVYDRAPGFTPQQAQHIAICLDKDGVLSPTDFDQEQALAQYLIRTGCLPASFKSPSALIMAFQLLKQHRVPFLAGIRCIAVIRGTLSIWGDLPMGLVKRSGLLDESKSREFVADADFNVISFANKNLHAEVAMAVCQLTRKDGVMCERSFTLREAKQAGLLSGGDSPWQKYRKRMLQMRARSHVLKDLFPDVLMGISIREYDRPDDAQGGDATALPGARLAKVQEALKAQNDALPPLPAPEIQHTDKAAADTDPATPASIRKARLNEMGYDV